MLVTSKYCLYYESYAVCYSDGATECDDFQITVLIKRAEYKKHTKNTD